MTGRPSDTPRVGIFGGSFNPPHAAHLIVAEVVREQFDLDQILWVPNRQSPFKGEHELAPASVRLEMVRLAVRENDTFAISDVELRRDGLSYTVDTIRHLQDEHPEADYHLVIGSDSLTGFRDWREPDEILRRVPLIVYPRSGYEDAKPPLESEGRIHLARAPLLDLSSTDLRRRMRDGHTIRYMVPDAVYRYIHERGLYCR